MAVTELKTYVPDTSKEYLLDDVLMVRGPKRHPVYNMFLQAGKGWKSTKIESPLATNFFDRVECYENYTNVATTVKVKVDSQNPINPKPNMKFFNERTKETMKTSTSAADITSDGTKWTLANCVRHVDGTSAVAGLADDQITFGNDVVNEDTEFTGNDVVTSIRQVYFTQIFQRAFGLSKTTQDMAAMIANRDGQIAEQSNRILNHIERKVFQQCFRGVHGASSSDINAETGYPDAREMTGLFNAASRLGGLVTDMGGLPIDTGLFDDTLSEINDLELPIQQSDGQNAGSAAAEYMFLSNGNTKNAINILESSKLERLQGDSKLINFLGTYVGGPLAVDFFTVPPSCLFDGEGILMHKSQYMLAPLNGGDFAVDKLAKVSRGDRYGVSGELGGAVQYPEGLRCFKGIGIS